MQNDGWYIDPCLTSPLTPPLSPLWFFPGCIQSEAVSLLSAVAAA